MSYPDIIDDSSIDVSDTSAKDLQQYEMEDCVRLLAKQLQGGVAVGSKEFSRLVWYKRRDTKGFLDLQQMVLRTHPGITESIDPQDSFDNLIKLQALDLRLEDIKGRSRVQESQTRKLDINSINAMIRQGILTKGSDGKKLGVTSSIRPSADQTPAYQSNPDFIGDNS